MDDKDYAAPYDLHRTGCTCDECRRTLALWIEVKKEYTMNTEYDGMTLEELLEAHERLTEDRCAIGQARSALRDQAVSLTEASLAILEEQAAIMAEMRRNTDYLAMIGQRLRQHRDERHMTLRDLSRQSGIAIGYLSDLERGKKTNPTLASLVKIAAALQTPLSPLIDAPEKEIDH
jgi:DNA-binding Xre family transcriptional regulator